MAKGSSPARASAPAAKAAPKAAAPKPAAAKPAAKPVDKNAKLAQQLVAAQQRAEGVQARARVAQAGVDLVRAKIETKGKRVEYDYGKNFDQPPKVKVVDVPALRK